MGIQERLYALSVATNERGCWLWSGHDVAGYGKIKVRLANGKWRNMRAPRIAYQTEFGPIPAGLHICHHCDAPACVNPYHLFLGTAKDNTKDRHAKGRTRGLKTVAGEANHQSKLTAAQAAEIAASSAKTADLMKQFGVARSTIKDIRAGITWRSSTVTQ